MVLLTVLLPWCLVGGWWWVMPLGRISSASPQLGQAGKGEEAALGGLAARGKWGGRFGYAKAPPWPGGAEAGQRSTAQDPRQKQIAPNLLKCALQVSSAFRRLPTSQLDTMAFKLSQTRREASQLLQQMWFTHRGGELTPPAHGYLSGISYKQLLQRISQWGMPSRR